jgi:hypothetical protein
MKRIAIVLSLLLACVSFSAADTITLFAGAGDMSGTLGSRNPPPSYSFVLFGGNIDFHTGSPSDFPFTSGLQNCIPCDPRGLVTILADSGIGVNTVGQYYDGVIQFNAVSFVSSLAPNGMLTVTYKANANLDFSLCTDPTCQNSTAFLLWPSKKLWLVTAQFGPDANVPGTYDFFQASFEAPIVPEPSSMLLVGSGILVVIGKVRKTHKD